MFREIFWFVVSNGPWKLKSRVRGSGIFESFWFTILKTKPTGHIGQVLYHRATFSNPCLPFPVALGTKHGSLAPAILQLEIGFQ